MKLGSLAAARPALYDRNATGIVATYENDLAPHALTTRWTVTVAAGKKAIVESAYLSSWRITVATAVGPVFNAINYTSGGSTGRALVAQYVNNTLYYREVYTLGQGITLYAAETLVYSTEDTSTGGQLRVSGTAKLTTFDA